MRRTSVLAVTLALMPATAAHADPIPWSYRAVPVSPVVPADPPGQGAVLLSEESSPAVAGNSPIVAARLRTVSVGPADSPDVFTGAGYGLLVEITDVASGQSGTVSLTGALSGKLSAAGAEFANAFTGLASHSLVLGGNHYTVTPDAFQAPGAPQGEWGSIGASVTVAGDAVEVPEPAALTLACVAAACVGLARCRRRVGPPRAAARPG